MNFPNFPRHEFSKENTDLLMQFLKLSKENKSNKNCNLDEYEKLKTFFPLVRILVFVNFNKLQRSLVLAR